MDRDCANRIVDPELFIHKFNAEHHDKGCDKANDCRCPWLDRVTACRDCHEACERAVERHGNVGLLITYPGDQHSPVEAAAAAMLVVVKILPIAGVASPEAERVEQPLKPNHANQRMNTPSAASVML